MTGWVASLSADEISNWEICKREQLFGSPASRAAGVRAGDTIYFWWSKRGLFARALATCDAERVDNANFHRVPWPHPERYKYLLPIQVLDELAKPLDLKWAALDRLVGIGGIPASQLPPVRQDQTAKLDVFFRNDVVVDLDPGHDDAADLNIPVDQDSRLAAVKGVLLRRGQRVFRERLLTAYGGRCVISNSSVEAVLEAAHISPYRGDATNDPRNGLLLRADIHTLFDLNLLTVLPDLTVRVAPELRSTHYASFHEDRASIDPTARLRPSPGLLSRHNANCSWL